MNVIQKLFGKKSSSIKQLEEKIDQVINQNKILLGQSTELSDRTQNETSNAQDSEVEKISSFQIENQYGSLKFEAITDAQFNKLLPRLQLNREEQDNLSGFLSSLAGGGVNVALMHAATRGLYQATANPATLMELSSGGLGSAVMLNGRISGHAGFIQAGSAIFTPIIIFQVLAAVTGQYYFHHISKQLNAVQEKLDELLTLHHIERQAKMVKAFHLLSMYLKRETFVTEDFLLINLIQSELTDIREEYYLMLLEASKKIKNDGDVISFDSLSDARRVTSTFESTGFIYKLKNCLIADELYHFAKIAQIHMNACYKNPDASRIAFFSTLLSEVESFKTSDIAFHKTESLYQETRKKLSECFRYSKDKSWFKAEQIQEFENKVIAEFNSFDEDRESRITSIGNLYKELTKPFHKENNIIIDNRSGVPKVFIE